LRFWRWGNVFGRRRLLDWGGLFGRHRLFGRSGFRRCRLFGGLGSWGCLFRSWSPGLVCRCSRLFSRLLFPGQRALAVRHGFGRAGWLFGGGLFVRRCRLPGIGGGRFT
jgi:hypothetical protein